MTCLVWVKFYFTSGLGFIFVSPRLGGNIIHCYCLNQNISEGLAVGVRLVNGTTRNRCCSRRLTHLWLPTGSWVGGGRMDTQWADIYRASRTGPKGYKEEPPPPNNSNTVSEQIWRVKASLDENHFQLVAWDWKWCYVWHCILSHFKKLVFTCHILLNCCWMML